MYASATPEISADQLNRSVLAGTPYPVAGPGMRAQAAVYDAAESESSADDLNRMMLAAGPPSPASGSILGDLPSGSTTDADKSAEDLNRRALVGNASEVVASTGSGVQVGAFSSPSQARVAAENARGYGSSMLGATQVAVTPVSISNGSVLYRARLVGIPASTAGAACDQLAYRGISCIVLPPDGRT